MNIKAIKQLLVLCVSLGCLLVCSWATASEMLKQPDGFFSLWDSRYLTPHGSGLYSSISSDSFSEVMSIDAIADHFRGPLEPGRIAVTHNTSEAGLFYRGWRLSRVLRYDYVLEFSEDTALLNFQLEHGGSASINTDYRYEIYLKADHLRSRGYSLGKTLPIFIFGNKTALLDIELSWLESRQFYDGYIEGTFDRGNLTEGFLEASEQKLDLEAFSTIESFSAAVAEGEQLKITVDEVRELVDSSDLWLEADYAYYRPGLREDEIDSFQDVYPLNAHGKGYTFSFELFLSITHRWTAQFAAKDLLAEIKWRDTGITEGSVYATQAGQDALSVIDRFVQQDIINRFSGQDFYPLNPDNPDDPAAVLPEVNQQIQADNADIVARKGHYTQHLPTQYRFKTNYQIVSNVTAELAYRKNRVVDFWELGALFWNVFRVAVEPESDAYRLGVQHRYGSLLIRSDQRAIDEAKRLSIAASLRVPLF